MGIVEHQSATCTMKSRPVPAVIQKEDPLLDLRSDWDNPKLSSGNHLAGFTTAALFLAKRYSQCALLIIRLIFSIEIISNFGFEGHNIPTMRRFVQFRANEIVSWLRLTNRH